jgi:hypothetical protein
LPGALFLSFYFFISPLRYRNFTLHLTGQRAIADLNYHQEKLQLETDRRHKCELQLDDQEEAAYEWRTALIVLATLVLLDALARALWHRYREGEPPLDR